VSRKKSGTYGAFARSHPKSVRWMVDYDYASKLKPEDKEWLAEFSDRYYGADFRGDEEHTWPTEARREAFQRKNAANADVLTRVREGAEDVLDLALEAPEVDTTPLPRYLATPRYQGALETFRSHLKSGRSPGVPEATEDLAVARERLREITHGTSEEDTSNK